MLPKDIDPESRCRLPIVKRDQLDDTGKRLYDLAVDPNGKTIRGLKGPGGLKLHSPKLAELMRPVNDYLRFETAFSARIREVAILITARSCDSQFEWAAHEAVALKEGTPKETVEAIKHRRPTTGLDDTDATIIQLGREMFLDRKVTSETYAKALKIFGPKNLLDLVSLMGNYAMTAAMLCAFDMQLDEGVEPMLPK
jgi:4-carboxymuconolactone decarboxylase